MFKTMSIRLKYSIFVALTLTFFSLVGMFVAVRTIQSISQEEINRFKKSAYAAKQTELKSAVEIAMKTINAFYSRTFKERIKKEVEQKLILQMDILVNIITNYFNHNKGKIPLPRLKEDIIKIVQNARYGKDGYFWINDLHPYMVMHPFRPELNGKDLSDYKDPNGKYLFIEMVKVVKEKGVEVVFEDEEAYPISEETVCPKCGKKGAYYFFKQTRSSDEPETRFLKCIHCGYTWREYD